MSSIIIPRNLVSDTCLMGVSPILIMRSSKLFSVIFEIGLNFMFIDTDSLVSYITIFMQISRGGRGARVFLRIPRENGQILILKKSF